MVYKIRNKSFFLTVGGWKNHYHNPVLNDVTSHRNDQTFCLTATDDAPALIRYMALYRNTSRKVKQYLYGNQEFENCAILFMKERFTFVKNCETPVHLVQPCGTRRIIHQGDRDYELINNNSHPYQLEQYKANNEYVQSQMESIELRANGEKPLEDQVVEVFGERIAKLKEAKGADFSTQDFHKLCEEIWTLYRVAQGAEKSRQPNGEFKDFLEVRRPFMGPDVTSVNAKVA